MVEEEDVRVRPAEPGSKIHRTNTAEILNAGTDAVNTVARFTPQQAITILVILLVGFICVTQTFQTLADREERRVSSRERQDAAAATIRENNAQVEMTRQHYEAQSINMRTYFSDQTERRMRFEAEERAKDRAVLTRLTEEKAKDRELLVALLASFEKLREELKKP